MTVELNWHSQLEHPPIPGEWISLLRRLLTETARSEGVEDGEVSLTFVDDETIRQLNLEYRGMDKSTDVLSFPQYDHDDQESGTDIGQDSALPDLLGDIVISVPTAVRQAETYGHSVEREIGFLFVHGFLHLLGYDHQDEDSERTMFRKQEEALQKAGLSR